MRTLRRRCPAKINLTLRVTGVRADGYHEIESLVARVGLCDEVSVQRRDDGEFVLRCDDPAIPTDGRNLVLKAAQELARIAGSAARGAELELLKRIPAGAGLGGGSSNAATTLLLLDELWSMGLSAVELARCAANIGSDVPLFLAGPVCVLRGRGVEIEDLGIRLHGFAVLVLPEIHCATSAVYAAWDRLTARPLRPGLRETVDSLGDGIASAMPILYNDLEAAAHAANAELAAFANRLGGLGAARFSMSGSGAAYFTLCDDEQAAQAIAKRVRGALQVRSEVVTLEVG